MQKSMTVRICATCKKALKFHEDGTQEGIYCCGDYFHEGECVEKSFEGTGQTWAEHYEEVTSEDGSGDCYFTEWEPEYNEDEEGNQ